MVRSSKLTASQAESLLALEGEDWWTSGKLAQLGRTCEAAKDDELANWPIIARWRALCAAMTESAEWSYYLDKAYVCHIGRGEADEAAVDAHMALALCFVDIGSMRQLTEWIDRSAVGPSQELLDGPGELWVQLGRVARAVRANRGNVASRPSPPPGEFKARAARASDGRSDSH
jgi:hypothetical protein